MAPKRMFLYYGELYLLILLNPDIVILYLYFAWGKLYLGILTLVKPFKFKDAVGAPE